jgi:hypothetical protein
MKMFATIRTLYRRLAIALSSQLFLDALQSPQTVTASVAAAPVAPQSVESVLRPFTSFIPAGTPKPQFTNQGWQIHSQDYSDKSGQVTVRITAVYKPMLDHTVIWEDSTQAVAAVRRKLEKPMLSQFRHLDMRDE